MVAVAAGVGAMVAESVVVNRKVRIPNVSASLYMAGKWQDMKLR